MCESVDFLCKEIFFFYVIYRCFCVFNVLTHCFCMCLCFLRVFRLLRFYFFTFLHFWLFKHFKKKIFCVLKVFKIFYLLHPATYSVEQPTPSQTYPTLKPTPPCNLLHRATYSILGEGLLAFIVSYHIMN